MGKFFLSRSFFYPMSENREKEVSLVEIITKLVNDPKLADYIRSKLSTVVDAETVEADIARVEKALKRAKANLKQRYDERDELDPTDPVDCVAIQGIKRSIDNLSVKIV